MNTMNRSCELSFCFFLISALVTSASGFSLTTPSGTVNVNFNGTITASLTASQETYTSPPSGSGSNLTTLEGPSTLGEAGVAFVYNTNSSNPSTVFVAIAQTGLKNITLVQLIEIPNIVIANITDVVPALNDVGQASSAGAPIPTDVADAIYASPEKYFIQILTTTYPNGGISGSLTDTTIANGDGVTDSDTLIADALPANVVPPVADSFSIDTASCDLFVVNSTGGTNAILYFVVYTSIVNMTSSVAIYSGPAGQAGSLYIDLTPSIRLTSLDRNNMFRGSVSVPQTTTDALLASPSSFYFQVERLGAAVARSQLSNPTTESATPPLAPATPPPPTVDPGPVLGGTAGNSSAGNSVRATLGPLALSLLTGLLAFASF